MLAVDSGFDWRGVQLQTMLLYNLPQVIPLFPLAPHAHVRRILRKPADMLAAEGATTPADSSVIASTSPGACSWQSAPSRSGLTPPRSPSGPDRPGLIAHLTLSPWRRQRARGDLDAAPPERRAGGSLRARGRRPANSLRRGGALPIQAPPAAARPAGDARRVEMSRGAGGGGAGAGNEPGLSRSVVPLSDGVDPGPSEDEPRSPLDSAHGRMDYGVRLAVKYLRWPTVSIRPWIA